MFKIKYNNAVIYDPRLKELQIMYGVVKRVINKAGSFVFTMPPANKEYETPKKLKGTIHLYDNDDEIFRGRVINEEYDMRKCRKLSCEGALAFFNDTVVRPYDYSGSVRGYLEMLVNQHNSQVEADRRFTVGNVTVTDNNDYIVRANTNYPDTWSEIEEKLLENGGLGGYLMVRISNGNMVLDYLAEIEASNDQVARFGSNLLDLSWINKGEDIATVIVPIGARSEDTEERVTIESVNNGLDYIEDARAIERYGRISKTVLYRDVTIPANLLAKARNDLAAGIKESTTYTIRAADLSKAGYDVETFRFAEKLKVKSTYHDIAIDMLVSSMTIDLLHPEQSSVSLGDEKLGFTGMSAAAIKASAGEVAEKAMTSQEAAKRYLEQLVENSSGLFYTDVEQEDESIITYAHDKHSLDDSTLIIMFGSDAVAISNDGGETWPYGFDFSGNAILAKIYAEGINADYIDTGRLTVGNGYIDHSGQFSLASIRSMGSDNQDVFVKRALFVAYGAEFYAANDNNQPFLDFHREVTDPADPGKYDFSARISNSSTNNILIQGERRTAGSTPAACTVTAGAFTQTSDRRLKKYISELDPVKAIQFLKSLKPSRFEYKHDTAKFHHGFIYDEVDEAKYERDWQVTQTQDMFGDGVEYGSVSLIEIVPDIVAALQDVLKRLERLEGAEKG